MNAILREREVTVLTNEAIEVHLSYLRPAVETLIEKVDQANKDRAAGDAALAEKITAGDAVLAEKVDKCNEKIDRTSKELIERFSKLQGSLDGIKWIGIILGIVVSGFSIARDLGWR